VTPRSPEQVTDILILVRIKGRRVGNESTAGIAARPLAIASHVSAHENSPSMIPGRVPSCHRYETATWRPGRSRIAFAMRDERNQSHSCQARLVIFVEHIQSSNHRRNPAKMSESGSRWAATHSQSSLIATATSYHAYHGTHVGVVSRV
jgi:hypothetical protein